MRKKGISNNIIAASEQLTGNARISTRAIPIYRPANGQKSLPRTSVVADEARVVDLCCGMGGLSYAASKLGMKVIGGVDSNPNALRTFARNFPAAEAIAGGVQSRKVQDQCRALLDSDDKGNHLRLVLSGPPCQGFSAAGSRDPQDQRNRVLVAVAHAIARIQPDCALIENVPTVLANKHGSRIRNFRKALDAGEYYIQDILLNSSDFGVSQKRKRAFFFITRDPLERDRIYSLLERYKGPPVTPREALHGLPTPTVRPDTYNDEAGVDGPANHFAMRHSRRVIEKIAAILPGTGPMSYRRLHPVRLANTLFSGHRAPPAHYKEPRSITVREAARLQGFPDSFRVYGSFANQMEQVTNAVPPPLAYAVLSVMLETLCFKEKFGRNTQS